MKLMRIFFWVFIRVKCLFISQYQLIVAVHQLNGWEWPDGWYKPIGYKNRDIIRWLHDYLEMRITDTRMSHHYHIVEYLGHDEEFFEGWMELKMNKDSMGYNEYYNKYHEITRLEKGRKLGSYRESQIDKLL